MSEVVLFLSLGLLVRTSGQISLCQIGFLAIGAAASGHMLEHHVPWLIAVLLAGAVTVPVGALIAIPAIRLSGLYLALSTLGFGILLANYFYGKTYFFGSRVGLHSSRPSFMSTDKEYYYVLLAFAVASMALVVLVERARLGRLLRGLADSPLALSTLGVSVNITRVLVFCLSAFLAGISGAIGASIFGGVTQDSYSYVVSLVILAIFAISGSSTIVAAVIAPLISVVQPAYIHNANATNWLQLGFGAAAIGTALLSEGRFGALMAKGLAQSREQSTTSAPTRFARRIAGGALVPIARSRLQEVGPDAG
jgi:ABC-type branched-subunit amino acid transport system permease subunit